MIRVLAFFSVAAVLSLAAVACGGSGAIGEACDTPGATDDECEAGAICDETESGDVVCLAVCEEQEDCASDESCNGVTGSSTKACHPKDDGDGAGIDDGGSGKDK
jgi:hypothetical protein